MSVRDKSKGAKRPLAFRVRPETADALKERAHELGETQTELVERYIEEGIRLGRHPLIYFRDGAGGREPAMFGSGLRVRTVIETVRQNDNSIKETAEYLEQPEHLIAACVAYYADYQQEIDEAIAGANAFAEREEARWRREQQLLA
jgi:uncharacterized protein (DUF433 family)